MSKSTFVDSTLRPKFKVVHDGRYLWEIIADTPDKNLTPDALVFKQRVHACVDAAKDIKKLLENDYLTAAQRTQLNKRLLQAEKEVDQCKEEGNAWEVKMGPWNEGVVSQPPPPSKYSSL